MISTRSPLFSVPSALAINNNPIVLISPTTGAINFQTSVSHTNLVPSAITASSGTAGQALTVSTGLTSIWGTVSAAPSMFGVKGLTGTVTSSQTVTLSAYQYVLQTTAATPLFFTLNSTASFTVNVGTSGPAANGRDVGPVFSSTFVHVYAITTGLTSTTPAGIASTTPPPAGPVLPTNYSAWSYLGTYPYSSASTTFTGGQRLRGSRVAYESLQNVLAGGTASSESSISLVSLVPDLAFLTMLRASFNTAGNGLGSASIRHVSGSTFFTMTGVNSAQNQSIASEVVVPNVSQQVFYQVSTGMTTGLTLDVLGYSVPNGGE